MESLVEFYPQTRWRRCAVHFYRNVFSLVPKGKVREVAAMLKPIHAQENREQAPVKAAYVHTKLLAMKLTKGAAMVHQDIQETLEYMNFPDEHWRHIRTNNPLERIMREILRRTRVVGNFLDGNSALMFVASRLRQIADTQWGTRRYLNAELLEKHLKAHEDGQFRTQLKTTSTKERKNLDTTQRMRRRLPPLT